MQSYIPDDRRYMTFEERAKDDPRYRGTTTKSGREVTICYCGKTVTHVNGRHQAPTAS